MKENYSEIFSAAKKSTVYAHAMVLIKEVVNEKGTDSEKFSEIKMIVFEAIEHLDDEAEND